MKKTAITLALASACAIAPAFAQWNTPNYERNDRYVDRSGYVQRDEYARVLEAQPVYTASREECWNPSTGAFEERRDRHSGIGKGAAVGAIAGGVLGNQVEHGEGAIAGALLGGLIGHQIEKQRDRDEDLDLSRCRIMSADNGIEGYDVRYRYKGEEYVTRMANDPGRRLLVGRDINWDGTPLG